MHRRRRFHHRRPSLLYRRRVSHRNLPCGGDRRAYPLKEKVQEGAEVSERCNCGGVGNGGN
ncbi:hypothetical protein M5K25_001252 [Dendrobium thyrsiflorum]|uniref:Uncharacterized protein n=1 Tax=Dendrobium thyrsiflorum TaxID=117978 RepID=A0ABD0VQL1_DENTH